MDLKRQLLELFSAEEDDLNRILSKFQKQTLLKNQFYTQVGKPCQTFSYIESGYFRVFCQTESREVTQWIAGKGYFITDLASFIFNQPNRWSIQALSDATIYTLQQSDYHLFEQQIPSWSIMEKRFMAKCFMQMESRIFKFISTSAEERYQEYFENNKDIFQQVPLQYIASVLGMSAETLSRIRAKINS